MEALWYSDAVAARLLRYGLASLSASFRTATAVRNWLYDVRVLRTIPSPLPAVSVGNLSVGGTGKTPVTAYIVRRLREAGHKPAVVMRGYGKDETEVHALLNPGTPVYATPDRARGVARAARDGADVVVLDDAFQHRRAGRDVDVVLVSAEQWSPRRCVLPAGPFREPMRALRRATLCVVTHRVASPETVRRVIAAVRQVAPDTPVTSLHLLIDRLHPVTGDAAPSDLASLAGTPVLAVAGIGDAESFFRQLGHVGAVVDACRFADHHTYTSRDVADIVSMSLGHKYIVTTLKDAVKLRALWPAKGPPLWYVSQAVSVSDTRLVDTIVTRSLFR